MDTPLIPQLWPSIVTSWGVYLHTISLLPGFHCFTGHCQLLSSFKEKKYSDSKQVDKHPSKPSFYLLQTLEELTTTFFSWHMN